ncbi:DUF7546 family protein [Haloarchaeobius amylolyticus]|uniref:DUF7546 family protein n=1 Tax=Haloarchaeobius amylolyticus TaxID=1198296 RepID=UPI00226E3E46|nr:hypothetical protein [Haloarchaeobius amylolyticus]
MAFERVDLDPETVVPEPETLFAFFIVLTGEALLLGLYLANGGTAALDLLLLPLVWVNLGLWALWRAKPAPAPAKRKRRAAAIAVGYGLVLAYFGGLWSQGYMFFETGAYQPSFGWYVSTALPPGFGPAISYESQLVNLTILPYKVVGYVALTYLVYVTVIDAASSAVSGVLGLLSCVSCSWPVLATIVTGVAGSSSALATAAMQQSLPLSTAVFVVTVVLLYWRPSFW